MTNKTSGENQSETEKRWEKVQQWLEDYENRVGLPSMNHDLEIKKYFNYNEKQLEKLSPEDCSYAACILNQYAFHLQREQNREKSRIVWAEDQLKNVALPKASQYHGSFNQQEYLAARDDAYGRLILNIIKYAKIRVEDLNYLSSSVRAVSDTYTRLYNAKVRS